jgi:O-methyltransferase
MLNNWHYITSTIESICKEIQYIDGSIVECGSHIGCTAEVIALNSSKQIYLFDSWEGIPEIGKEDISENYKKGDWNISLHEAKENLKNYNNIVFMKGWYPDRFSEISDIKISFLHLDCSLYQSTKICLEHFWDQISEGGYVMCNYHDGHSKGPEQAFKKFFNGKREIVEYPTGVAVVKK